ncbi:MAG TPA: hypothetical protein VFX96_02700, partial [Pyrinomonadaceae bacterium]|nr:hypothetical protein [Pyrinomonadaceae bacterium]
ATFPREVAGMVLVDASHEEQTRRFEALMTPEQLAESRARRVSHAEGFDAAEVRARVAASRWRARIPLVVLVHGRLGKEMTPPGWSEEQLAARERVWRELQEDWARRSTRGRLVVAERSGHYIQNDQPELVVEAVREVVWAVRGRAAARRRRR